MTANPRLVKELGICEEDAEKINEIHEHLEYLLAKSSLGVFNQAVYDQIENLEFTLQSLWRFEVNPAYHKWKHRYEFKCEWVGKKYRCLTTGVEFIVPESVEERSFYTFGEAWLDVGRCNAYSRRSNCELVITQEVKL